jgi:hypothetical protein
MRAVPRNPALLALLLLAACAHAATDRAADAGSGAAPPPEPPTAWFPLAVGNSWTWNDRSPSGAPDAAPRRTVRIVSRDADGFFVDDARGALKAAHGCIQDRVRRLLCTPATLDRAWSSVLSETSTEHYRIVAVGVTTRVAAGTFDGCIVVRARNRAGADAEVVLETTYAPGVGPVRIETFAEVGGKRIPQVRAELAAYRIEGTTR